MAVLTGLVFPLAAKLDYRGAAATASRLYTADYLGAAFGALLVSTLLIPLLGVTVVCVWPRGSTWLRAVIWQSDRRPAAVADRLVADLTSCWSVSTRGRKVRDDTWEPHRKDPRRWPAGN